MLEIGCGEGGNLLPFAEKECNVTGIDRSEERISQAISYFKLLGFNGRFIYSDFFDFANYIIKEYVIYLQRYEENLTRLAESLLGDTMSSDDFDRKILSVRRDLAALSAYYEQLSDLGETLRQAGFSAHAPDFTEVYDLAANALVQAGVPFIEKKKSAGKDSPVYQRLWAMGQQLLEVIRHNRGGANKDLGKFADQIKALIDKWDR